MSLKKNRKQPIQNHSNNSSFIFGLIVGALIGAIIAIVIYRQNKGQVIDNLEERLKTFFQDLFNKQEYKNTKKELSKIKKKKKIIPKKSLVTKKNSTKTASKKKSAPKMFIKSKR